MDETFGGYIESVVDPKQTIGPLVATEDMISGDINLVHRDGVAWLRRAAENGHQDARVRLGNLSMENDPPLVDAGLHWYNQAIEDEDKPHPDALYNLGMIYFEGNQAADIKPNLELALDYFIRAAAIGDPSAQFYLGHLYRVGSQEMGVPQDTERALVLLESAAAQGHTEAQYYLAQLYRSGDSDAGLEPDNQKFHFFLNAAVDNEHADALFCLADMYFHGSDGLPVNHKKAIEYYKRACAEGSVDAMCTMGAIYYNGVGADRDYEKAFRYYQAAADRHSIAAWKNVAQMHMLGHGVPQSEQTALSIIDMIHKLTGEKPM